MGDDACWLDRTCLACGRFLDPVHLDDPRCPHCGEERITAVDVAPGTHAAQPDGPDRPGGDVVHD
jgi:hypothetical protein